MPPAVFSYCGSCLGPGSIRQDWVLVNGGNLEEFPAIQIQFQPRLLLSFLVAANIYLAGLDPR
jgi:hypothetical protein